MDYVHQRSPETLRTMGMIYGFLHVEFSCSKVEQSKWYYDTSSGKNAVLWVKDIGDCHMLRRYTVFSESGKRLPRKYKQYLVTSQEWLEWACEMGDPDAPFYLSLMYEYGMTHAAVAACGKSVARTVVQQHRDPDRAQWYMALAEERNSKPHLAYMVLSLHPLMKNDSEGAVEEEDYRIYNICSALCYDRYNNREAVQKITGKDGYQSLSRFLSILLAFYASQEFPGCMAYLGSLLTRLLDECNCRDDLFAQKYSPDFFKSYYLLCQEHVQETVNRLSHRMQHLQDQGDQGILFVLKDLNISFKTVK